MADATTPAVKAGAELTPFEVALEQQRHAERTLVRYTILGVIVGGIVCAAIWTLLVFLALQIADTSVSTGPALGMSAAVGVFAGSFYGGWAGTILANQAIERAELAAEAEEHELATAAPTAASRT
jgi:hypothetical protein